MIFQLIATDMSFADKSIYFVCFIIAMIVALTLHEFAHAFVAVKSGDPTPRALKRYTLNPLAHIDLNGLLCFVVLGIGWAKPVEYNPTNFKKHYKAKMFWVAISGVLTNLIIAFLFTGIFYLIAFLWPAALFSSSFLLYFFSLMIDLNVLLAIFNALPIYPLDGFNTIASFLKPDNSFVVFMRKYGSMILWGFVATVVAVYYATNFHILSFLVDGVEWLFDSFWMLVFYGV